MIDLYESGKLGPMNIAAFNGSAGAWKRFKINRPDGVARALYMLRPTVNVRVLQGNSTVAGLPATASMLAAFGYYPILVENYEDEFISILSNVAGGGDLEISIISDVATWTLAAA